MLVLISQKEQGRQCKNDKRRSGAFSICIRVVPSVVAEASIGAASSDAIVFCRLDGGVEGGILNGWLLLEIRTTLLVMIVLIL